MAVGIGLIWRERSLWFGLEQQGDFCKMQVSLQIVGMIFAWDEPQSGVHEGQ